MRDGHIVRRPRHIGIALLSIVFSLEALVMVGSHLSAAWAQEELFVSNAAFPVFTSSVTVYARTASGNTTPLRTLQGPATGLQLALSLAVDSVHDELLVGNSDSIQAITVYPRTASGNTAPLRTLQGLATGLSSPRGLAVDPVHDELVVLNGNSSITVYPRTASGNTAPIRTLDGDATGLRNPTGLFVDVVHDELLVANLDTSSITVYARTASGNTAPLRTLQGPATGLSSPEDLVVDTANNELVVVNSSFPSPSITVYARTASGNTAPLRTLQGPATGLASPRSLAVTTSAAAAAFVTRLYQQVLGRDPEPGGVAGWVQQIQREGSVVPTVLAFFHSQEFLGRNTTNEQFLTILYHTFFNRDPDPAGFNAFLTSLQAGQLTRDNLLDIFIDSAEFTSQTSFLPPLSKLQSFVTTLYVRILGRGPDQAGLQSFVSALQQSCNTSTVLSTIRAFLASPEFQARQTTNTGFVTLLYRVFLDRVPDAPGLAAWVALLDQGSATRDQLVMQFAASPEFQAVLQQLCS